jgi:hypothetical protein
MKLMHAATLRLRVAVIVTQQAIRAVNRFGFRKLVLAKEFSGVVEQCGRP